jgi:hypothetical protein
MTDLMPLFGTGSKGGAVKADSRPHSSPQRTVWSRLILKYLPRCDACVRELHEVWGDGVTPYAPPKTARHKRVLGDEELLLCNEHAEQQKKGDEK